MLMKLLILLGAITMFGVFIFRAARGLMGDRRPERGNGRAPSRASKTQDLIKCQRCGIFLPSNRTCDCSDAA